MVFDVCSPGRGAEANELTEGALPVQRAYEARFLAPLDKAAESLTIPHESAQSPIAAQIMRAASDPAIGWSGEERVLNLLSDGLDEHPPVANLSRRRHQLSTPAPEISFAA